LASFESDDLEGVSRGLRSDIMGGVSCRVEQSKFEQPRKREV